MIRGLAQTFATARIQNVSFFLDGVYLLRQSMLNIGMIDMERIEVVKGPQNAIYGRNAFTGAVNYVTKKPTEEFDAYASQPSAVMNASTTRFHWAVRFCPTRNCWVKLLTDTPNTMAIRKTSIR